MKPIELRIKGINSFQEEQVVDFEKLTKEGLFGIFGPTGSGKSTILDAMTLALYGELARDTKDFVNLNVDAGAVSFTFSIREKEVRTYRVSRTFRRNKENGNANTKSARLVQIFHKEEGTDEKVLEDSVRGVKEAVIRLIGLEFSDFSRTVVLPQGKFSEFLKLSGAKRNDMLERLFHLYPYGVDLVNRLRENRMKTQNALSEKEGQLLAYEDVTEEALKQAGEKEQQYRQELLREEKVYEEHKKAHARIEADYARTKELVKEEEKLRQLLEKKPEIEGYRMRIEDGKKAEKVLPYVTEEKRAGECRSEQEEKTLKLNREMADIEEQLSGLLLKEKKIRQEERERIPALSLERQRLSDLEEDISKRVLPDLESYLETEKQMKKAEKEKKTLQLQYEKDEQAAAVLEQEMEALREQKKQLSIPREYRLAFQQAAECIREYTEAGKQRKQQESRVQKLKKRVQEGEERSKQFFEEYESWLASRIKEQEEEKQALSGYIRTLMKPGEPCPVCGNRDCIPELAGEADARFSREGIDWKTHEREAKQQENEYLEEKVRQQTLQSQLGEQLCQQEEEWQAACGKESACHLQAEAELNKVNAIGERLQCRKKEITISGYEEEDQRLKEMEELREQLEERLSEKEQKLRELAKSRQEQSAAYDRAKEQSVEAFGKCQTLEHTVKQDYDRLLSVIGDDIRSYEGKWKEYQAFLTGYSTREAQTELVKEISRIQKESESVTKQLESVRQRETEGKKLCAAAAGELENMKKEYERCRKQCEEQLAAAGYMSGEQVLAQILTQKEQEELERAVTQYETRKAELTGAIESGAKALEGRRVSKEEWEQSGQRYQEADRKVKELNGAIQVCAGQIARLKEQLKEKKVLLKQRQSYEHRKAILLELESMVKGKKFVEYAAREKLMYVAKEASRQLKEITNGVYGLELYESGEFYIRDYKNGGILRSAGSLSGGELFLASLSLALALSSQIQLKGTAPLEFFFLDEGFGTLDEPLLDVVMDSLEKLQNDRRRVGIISHVESLKTRIPVKLMVKPAEAGKGGSRIWYEWS